MYLNVSFCIFMYLPDPGQKIQKDTFGYESKLCMERSALFRTYGTKGFRNWSCSGPLECDEI